MVKKYIKHFSCLLLLFSLVFAMKSTTFAASFSDIDFAEKGSISMTLRDIKTHEVVPGGTFALYYVGEIDRSGHSLGFKYNKAFENNGMLLDDLREEGLAEHLASYAVEKNISGETRICEDGKVVWEKLELGLYLVVQTERADGYYPIDSFLISVPFSQSNDEKWTYDVDASSKVEPSPEVPSEKDLTVKKVWVDDGKKTPESIEVKLYRDNKEYESCILGVENHWSKKWTGLSEEYQWTVKEIKVPAGYKVSYNKTGGEITITNTSQTEKPPVIQTGQLNWPVPVLALAGVLIFAMGWILTFMKRKK